MVHIFNPRVKKQVVQAPHSAPEPAHEPSAQPKKTVTGGGYAEVKPVPRPLDNYKISQMKLKKFVNLKL